MKIPTFSITLLVLGSSLISSISAGTEGYIGLVQTITPTATQASLPEKPETLIDIQTLLEEVSESCQLPCFWGVTPGYTTAADVIEFLKPDLDYANAQEPYDVEFSFRENQDQEPIFYLVFSMTDDLVVLTEVIANQPSNWLPPHTLELPHLLSIMPSVPQAYLSISLGQRRMFLTVAYDEGIVAQYPFELQVEGEVISPTIDKPFLFCPSLDLNAFIKLRLSNSDAEVMLEEYGTLLSVSRNKTWPVERMTGMEVQEFVAQIIENPDECIQLPSYPDLLEMGYEF
jgi:hypothetical protein